MHALSVPAGLVATATAEQRRNRRWWWCGYAACLALTMVIAKLAWGYAPHPFALALLVVLLGAAVAVARPVLGVYLTVFFAMVGDANTAPWYPFVKNLSSRESILYVSDQLIISPLEIFLGALVLGWVLRMAATRHWTLRRGPLFWPVIAFTGLLLVGLGYGLATGGDRYVATWELRPILCLPVLYLIVTNVLDRLEQYRRLFWLVMIAVTINSFFGLFFLSSLSPLKRAGLESLGDHSASLHANTLIVMIAATWLLGSRSFAARALLPFMAIPVVWVYLVSQRRAAIIALIAAVILLGAVLRWRHRRVFRVVAPIALLLGIGYTAAFWNATGVVGFPAQAVKTVVAPDEQTSEDQASDYYRVVENYDIIQTIKAHPLTGVGFGQRFLTPIPLPAINFFVLREYMSHNSILWVWMKAGVGGFVAMLFLFGTAVRTGAANLVRLASGTDAAVGLLAVAYVVMFAVFTYVDISWDPRTMVLLAIALAQIDSAYRITTATTSPPTVPAGARDRSLSRRRAAAARAPELVGATS